MRRRGWKIKGMWKGRGEGRRHVYEGAEPFLLGMRGAADISLIATRHGKKVYVHDLSFY